MGHKRRNHLDSNTASNNAAPFQHILPHANAISYRIQHSGGYFLLDFTSHELLTFSSSLGRSSNNSISILLTSNQLFSIVEKRTIYLGSIQSDKIGLFQYFGRRWPFVRIEVD